MIEIALDIDEMVCIKDLIRSEIVELNTLKLKASDINLFSEKLKTLNALYSYFNELIERGED